jgi:hypothetical protein
MSSTEAMLPAAQIAWRPPLPGASHDSVGRIQYRSAPVR